METKWFRKSGWFYIPASVIGLVLILLVILFCLTVFLAVDKNSHSVSDTLYAVFPYFISAFTVLFWIANNTLINKQ